MDKIKESKTRRERALDVSRIDGYIKKLRKEADTAKVRFDQLVDFLADKAHLIIAEVTLGGGSAKTGKLADPSCTTPFFSKPELSNLEFMAMDEFEEKMFIKGWNVRFTHDDGWEMAIDEIV